MGEPAFGTLLWRAALNGRSPKAFGSEGAQQACSIWGFKNKVPVEVELDKPFGGIWWNTEAPPTDVLYVPARGIKRFASVPGGEVQSARRIGVWGRAGAVPVLIF